MYGRLKWTDPAQTITSGYGSIGQGRYMHPSLTRALTPHEAARLQGFPDYFKFHDAAKRAELATMIGNAVPPALSAAVFSVLMPSLVDLD
ncbi:MAG: DNA cytosine methyltransferase [Frankiaceae bacterium]|nr:DNA cytosine methyltransferase [Frankiaceae bacterium]